MAKLIYSAITSLNGYIADERDRFDWVAPDEEVHRFVNELERMELFMEPSTRIVVVRLA